MSLTAVAEGRAIIGATARASRAAAPPEVGLEIKGRTSREVRAAMRSVTRRVAREKGRRSRGAPPCRRRVSLGHSNAGEGPFQKRLFTN